MPCGSAVGAPALVQSADNGVYTGGGEPLLTLPGPVTAGNLLVASWTRRGGPGRPERVTRDDISGPERDFTSFGTPVQFGAPLDASFICWRVATGDEQTLFFEDAGHIVLYEFSGLDAADAAAAQVLRSDQQSAATFYPIGVALGHVTLAVWLYGLDFNDTDHWTMGSGWTVDYQDSTDGGSPWTEMGHALPGSLYAASSGAVSIAWGGMAVGINSLDMWQQCPAYEEPAGATDNSNQDFATSHGWVGSLRVMDNGHEAAPDITAQDPVAGTFTLGYAPAAARNSALRVGYRARP